MCLRILSVLPNARYCFPAHFCSFLRALDAHLSFFVDDKFTLLLDLLDRSLSLVPSAFNFLGRGDTSRFGAVHFFSNHIDFDDTSKMVNKKV